ncbi:helicase-related protein [Bosea sp. TND4EK4]|uniref:helicase-related protein n=1 Tax=Bosea sp. TND4EK4 TaxID=1907408 RepID=UPI0009545363|nr:helicase-related protein [Bosea sp. TND4EK4]SIR42208.1 Helicase conserved C-terminal domain-containing protein [Bosea sp. TND4EK4]
MPGEPFRAGAAIASLKAFQRRTVDYVFGRFYDAASPAYQFLVADEVGLGKTMVARGVIAKAIEHLWDKTDRIDILYICSNQAIAAQNLNRLNVLGRAALALPTRMTLVPLQMRGERSLIANKVNFISLTPGTTFDLRSSTGVAEERALLFHLLRPLVSSPRGLQNLLQVDVGTERWESWIKHDISLNGVDQNLIDRFRKDVAAEQALNERLGAAVERFRRWRDYYPADMKGLRNATIARLRSKLSHACVDALQPDLIIMDEFQRFPDLLHGDSDAAHLARDLFDYRDSQGNAARTLLLSATPYRMLTLQGDDAADGDHYRDFLETLTFLFGQVRGRQMVNALELEMRAFRVALHGLPASQQDALAQKAKVETSLKQVMCRTERVSSTADRDSMVCEPLSALTIQADDLRQAMLVSGVARALEAPEIIEYWKSAPYLLNFMRDYTLKRLLIEKEGAKSSPALASALSAAKVACLDQAKLDSYARIEPANGRMRAVMGDVFQNNLEQHLWIPPSLPYYGEGSAGPRPTKALIFSSWTMVPDAIAATLSYEAERRMGAGETGRGYFDQKRPRPLQFRQVDGRLAGLRALLLIYPSPLLAELGDPLVIMSSASKQLSYAATRAAVANRLRPSLTGLTESPPGDLDMASAEWALPAVLDASAGNKALSWIAAWDGMVALANEVGFKDHVAALKDAAKGVNIGPVSDEALDLLVDVALGSPAVCALRALRRVAPDLAWDDPRLLRAAAQVSWGFRTLFNQHDAVALLRRGDEDRYWHRVLTFSAQQNLQAVLDEYAHYLVDAQGLSAAEPGDRVAGLGQAMADTLSIRPSQIDVDNPTLIEGKLKVGKFHMRGRFAMRLADYRDEEGAVARLGGVRDAFNSPFRPFVLATTSVGQEGLDFHPYCYRVYHWNLPGNPVDLEQREGRVHRFKGHAVRLNVAHNHGAELMGRGAVPADPWEEMFAAARAATISDTDLAPYWLCEGPVKVERRVPILPFSRETQRLEWLKRSLTVYRLAFGQPRQDDLLGYLGDLLDQDMSMEELEALQIRLQP